MANNLKKFSTQAEYSAATLNYPAVSWITSGDTVIFDKSEDTPIVYSKMIVSISNDGFDTFVYYNTDASDVSLIKSISLTSVGYNWTVQLSPITNSTSHFPEGGEYLVEYEISGDTLGDWVDEQLGSDDDLVIDLLISDEITTINALPTNRITALVLEAATPPTLANGVEINLDNEGPEWVYGRIYVPDTAVNTYKAASGWSTYAEYIEPVSEYSGNLPV